jgi:hypothetical protein
VPCGWPASSPSAPPIVVHQNPIPSRRRTLGADLQPALAGFSNFRSSHIWPQTVIAPHRSIDHSHGAAREDGMWVRAAPGGGGGVACG